MKNNRTNRLKVWLVFGLVFGLSVAGGILLASAAPVVAAPDSAPLNQAASYAGPDSCKQCHEGIVLAWQTTRHSQAFSSPIFQRDWSDLGSEVGCLECHTTGFDPANGSYAHEGVTCESCHGAFQPNHPEQSMAIKPDADLCANCHKSTTDEWRASVHGAEGIQCQDCHNPHSQTPKAETITALCGNCHKERGDSFTHGTHANAGLECSNCHMYTKPRMGDPIRGLIPTGHTFAVGSDACIGCHQDTVHTRDEIVKLSGQVEEASVMTIEDLQKQVSENETVIQDLQASSTVRLYTGLAQGAIVGLVTGGVAAWVVSKRIRLVEVEEE